MRVCPQCGTVAEPDARFCITCGSRLPDAAAGDAAGEPSRTEESSTPRLIATADGDEVTDTSMPVGEPTRVIGPELTTCPSCGGANAVRRRRCGRCGWPLHGQDAESGPAVEDRPEPEPAPMPPPPVEPAHPGRRRRMLIGAAVIVLGGVVGGGLGVAAALGLGPFSSRMSDLPAFDVEAYPDDASAIRPTAGDVTSVRDEDETTFGVGAMIDGSPESAWVSAPSDEAPGLLFGFDEAVWLTRIELRNGFPGAGDEPAAGRILRARLNAGNGQVMTVAFLDQDGPQGVPLPDPILTEEVTFTILDSTGEDVGIAEIRFIGHVATAADAARLTAVSSESEPAVTATPTG